VIEREIKLLISEPMFIDYMNKLNSLVVCKRILQINYYFDTPDFQNYSLGRTLRIRQKDNQLLLQYKYNKQYSGFENMCNEFEIIVDTFPRDISSKDFPCNSMDMANLYRYVGNLVTERFEYTYAKTIISLDKNYYLGKCDYEIEIEFQDYKQAEDLLKLLSIEKTKSHGDGKYSRFVKEMLRLKNEILSRTQGQ